jgi:hypothetical protein
MNEIFYKQNQKSINLLKTALGFVSQNTYFTKEFEAFYSLWAVSGKIGYFICI